MRLFSSLGWVPSSNIVVTASRIPLRPMRPVRWQMRGMRRVCLSNIRRQFVGEPALVGRCENRANEFIQSSHAHTLQREPNWHETNLLYLVSFGCFTVWCRSVVSALIAQARKIMKASMQKWLCEALSLHCMFRVMLKPSLRRDNVSKRASESRVILYPPPVEGLWNNGNGNEGNGFPPDSSEMS